MTDAARPVHPATAERRRSLWTAAALIVGVTGLVTLWQNHRDDAVGRELAALARPGDIRMLSSTTCGFCTRARHWLQARQIPFDECFIERDAACAAQFRALQQPGTPVLLVRGQTQLGFSPLQVRDRLAPPG
jgi:glutaredoxin